MKPENNQIQKILDIIQLENPVHFKRLNHTLEKMDESFFMSNMSPQEPAFNGGIWGELEELTRELESLSREG